MKDLILSMLSAIDWGIDEVKHIFNRPYIDHHVKYFFLTISAIDRGIDDVLILSTLSSIDYGALMKHLILIRYL